MEHDSKIHEEFSIIKISVEVPQYLEKNTIHHAEFSEPPSQQKQKHPGELAVLLRFLLRRNT